ncbi:MAG: hypothetical protein KBD64_08305 [Gammaproteobacteria bacterium]|nr:hypothetical protein [Gammaproteobacteria bacterium]
MANGQIDYLYDENDNLLSLKSSLTSLNQNPKINTLSPVNNSNLIFSYNNMQVVSIANASSPNKVAYSYDTLGNVLADNWSKYNYGVDGNLYSMSGKHYGNYEYDYNQQRVYQETKTIYGKEDIVTFYNKAGLALYDYNITKHKSNKYLYLNGQRIGKIAADIKDNINQNSITSYYYNDAQGSPLAEIDEQGKTLWREAYLPFGAKLLDEIDISVNKFGFVGKEFDESGLSYFGARYYNPVSGRFMAPDPADVKPEVPGTFNRYAYGYNNPYKYVDPDGRQIAPLPVMAVEFVLGGVAGGYAGWQEGGYKGLAIGFFVGGGAAVVGSVFSGGAAGALAARSFVKGATTLAIDVSTNAAGSVARSYINTGKPEMKDAMTGAVYGAGANRWMHRYGKFSSNTAAEAFTSGKYAALTSAAAEGMHSNYFKNHSFTDRSTTMTTQIIKYN